MIDTCEVDIPTSWIITKFDEKMHIIGRLHYNR